MTYRARKVLRVLGAGAVAAFGVLLTSCWAPVPPELIDARLMYDRARQGPASTLAPDELAQAASALRVAESRYQYEPRSEEAKDLAYVAQRRVQIAESKARLETARNDKAAAEQQLASVRARSASELAEARARLQAQEEERRQREASQAEQARQGTEQQDQLARAQRQVEEQQRQLQQRQQELEEARAGREAAEASQRAALEKLERIAEVREEQRGTVITLPGSLLFAPGKTELSGSAQRALEQVAEALKSTAPEQHVMIEGHTDARGSEDLNYELSVLRANAVKDFLSSRGIERSRIEVIGFGKTRPIASNDTAEGRATNRRVEIIIERGVGGAGPNQR